MRMNDMDIGGATYFIFDNQKEIDRFIEGLKTWDKTGYEWGDYNGLIKQLKCEPLPNGCIAHWCFDGWHIVSENIHIINYNNEG